MRKNRIQKALALCGALCLILAACARQAPQDGGDTGGKEPGRTGEQAIALKVGASPSPHAEILEQAKPLLAEKGIDLQIQEFTDYILPNEALEQGELDANFFQHGPYLADFNAENKTHLKSIGTVHFEAMGIYAGQCGSLEALEEGAKVGVPSDTTNEARALQLLAAKGLITLKEGAGLEATAKDIAENPKHIEIVEMEAATLPRSLPDLALAVINGNYALEGGVTDALIESESADSEAAQTFANVVAIREDDNRAALQTLLEVLHSDAIRAFIEDKYDTIFPVF